MKVYNVNLGIGFASSGVEYAQAYRYQLLKEFGIEQKYIFLDMVLALAIKMFCGSMTFLQATICEIVWLAYDG